MPDNPRSDIHNSDVPIVCRACEARHKGVCGALNPQQLTELARHTTKHKYDASAGLVSDGAKVDRYANIMSGVIKLAKLTADGRQQIVGLQFAPDFLGRPFSQISDFDVEAATDVRVCSFPRDVLNKLTRESPELEHRLHAQTLKELDEARDWMLALGRKSASERVAGFLCFIAEHINPEIEFETGPVRFDIPLKRADMADFLGLTIETVSRQLTKLRQARVIEIENNRTVIIPDLAKLRAATGA
ncbi:helix-turn-helix domain-containing protein [Aestuariivirga litoralis]|uniref:helix-turn-helix domain-containing protein n=1 Tax=Aestuariivirga litoralis TaxID=2650924 RepID=UPI0018C797C4